MNPKQLQSAYLANQSLDAVATEYLVTGVEHFNHVKEDINNFPVQYTVQDLINTNNIIEYLTSLIEQRRLEADITWKNTLCSDHVRHGISATSK